MSKLPSLKEVLSRKSQPPVCLYNYYIVLRDRLAIEPWLDFWLDVSQATALHKRYIKHRQTPDLWPHLVMPSKKPRMVPTEEEMIATVDRIYLKYIAPSAEKEIFMLPEAIRHAIGNQLAQDKAAREDPAIYLEAQKHVYNQLESTFHLFIRYKVFMNLTLPQQIGRLVLGFLSLWAGFTLEFCLIFLDIQPWQKRLWAFLPIGLGVFCFASSVLGIDPFWVLIFNTSETITFEFNPILHPEVKKILIFRSWVLLGLIVFITCALMSIFCAVAGHRL